jgi:hypothetical protein
MSVIGVLIRTAFLWCWEKYVENKLYYYAQGKNDATKALQFHFDRGGVVDLKSGTYRVTETLIVGKRDTTILDGTFLGEGANPLIHIPYRKGKPLTFEHVHLTAPPIPGMRTHD